MGLRARRKKQPNRSYLEWFCSYFQPMSPELFRPPQLLLDTKPFLDRGKSSEESNIILSIAAFAAAIAALIFAALQTTGAIAQHVQVSSRCSQRVTGIFNLKAGSWFHVSSLSWNPQYRMPVLTMAALRHARPTIEQDISWTVDFHAGLNYSKELNGYSDYSRLHVVEGEGRPSRGGINYGPTAILAILAALWTPLGLVLSTLSLSICFLPACLWDFCNCSCIKCRDEKDLQHKGPGRVARGLMVPLTWPWKHAIRYKPNSSTKLSRSPGLEPAAWCQFLTNYQTTWWGHADIRWEWRLATMIPADVYGATIETTMADVSLLAALGGMHASSEPGVIARTLCGEMLTLSQHPVLGRTVYYRSGRKNTNGTIAVPALSRGSRAMLCVLAVHRHVKARLSTVVKDQEAIALLLSRPRAEFDLQVDCTVGALSWVFETNAFQEAAARIYDDDSSNWAAEESLIFQGPLGRGINACSCLLCCRYWWISLGDLGRHQLFSNSSAISEFTSWPALLVQRPSWTLAPVVGPIPPGSNVRTTALSVAHLEALNGACLDRCGNPRICRCGPVVRVPRTSAEPSVGQRLAVAAINTKWLQSVRKYLISTG